MCAHQRVRAHTHTLHSRPSDTEEIRLGKGGEHSPAGETRVCPRLMEPASVRERPLRSSPFCIQVGVHTGVQTLLVATQRQKGGRIK